MMLLTDSLHTFRHRAKRLPNCESYNNVKSMHIWLTSGAQQTADRDGLSADGAPTEPTDER
jgi:hypothetical protein